MASNQRQASDDDFGDDAPKTSVFTAWLELMRISNLPTVWSNVLVGTAIAAGAARNQGAPLNIFNSVDWVTTIAYVAAVSLFYVGGMALNDVVDANRDVEHRPGRPIPSGRIELHRAQTFVFLCFVAGLLIVGFVDTKALVIAVPLVVVIFLYDFLNKKSPGAIVFMGASRALVYLLAASGADADFGVFNRAALFFALILGVYTVAITVIARGEHLAAMGNRKWLSLLMPAMVGLGVFVVQPMNWVMAAVIGAVVLVWMGYAATCVFKRPPKTMNAVLTWLAGISLIDGFFLALLGAPMLATIALVCFVCTVAGHRKILGT